MYEQLFYHIYHNYGLTLTGGELRKIVMLSCEVLAECNDIEDEFFNPAALAFSEFNRRPHFHDLAMKTLYQIKGNLAMLSEGDHLKLLH